MKIQRIFATLIGIVTITVGTLRFLPDTSHPVVNIPLSDAIIHITTGVIFIGGAWIKKGKYVRTINLVLGAFYILFGVIEFNLPHIILGVISLVISLVIKPAKII
ncbi:MAG TPA: hypothetical protein VN958_00275 [Chitinophagaceae bacterium]|nr:hypothetical protein [Chitinophagaceae bacterium]